MRKEHVTDEFRENCRKRMLGNKYGKGNKGGKGSMLGKYHTEETKRKLSAASKGNHYALGHKDTKETRAKKSRAKLGNQNLLGHTHSPETREKMSKSRSGEGNAFFGHFKDGNNYSLPHNNLDFIRLRPRVRERDNHTCILCKKLNLTGRDACCHHVDFDVWNNTMLNLATLCRSCHTKIHWQHRRELARA